MPEDYDHWLIDADSQQLNSDRSAEAATLGSEH
jgi:hypothetical protein